MVLNLAALFAHRQAVWIGLAALFPLILLMLTGLYLFARPYFARGRRPADASPPAA